MQKKAFTLVELLVAMAIIGVLIGLAIFGIGLVQRSARDTQRKSGAQDIKLAITECYNKTGNYPGSTQTLTGPSVTIKCDASGSQTVVVQLKGVAAGGSESGLSSTLYTYTPMPSPVGYSLCVQMEDGSWMSYGSSPTYTCTSSGINPTGPKNTLQADE